MIQINYTRANFLKNYNCHNIRRISETSISFTVNHSQNRKPRIKISFEERTFQRRNEQCSFIFTISSSNFCFRMKHIFIRGVRFWLWLDVRLKWQPMVEIDDGSQLVTKLRHQKLVPKGWNVWVRVWVSSRFGQWGTEWLHSDNGLGQWVFRSVDWHLPTPWISWKNKPSCHQGANYVSEDKDSPVIRSSIENAFRAQ